MEIPSSSPIYSPLKPHSDTYNLQASDQTRLFPSQDTDLPETQDVSTATPAAPTRPSSGQHQQHSHAGDSAPLKNTHNDNDTNDTSTNDVPSNSNYPAYDQDLHDYFYNAAPPYSDHPPSDLTLDPEVTIFSDSEYEVPDTESSDDAEPAPEKSTQNYLDALLTESVLESLPLPVERKESMRKKYGDRNASHV